MSIPRHINGNLVDSSNVSSIAILKRHILCDCLVLVKQYRPALKSYTLEFPAKMIKHPNGMSVDELAVQDMEDETGYSSMVVKHVSPETALDPDLSGEKIKLVSLVIDGDDPINDHHEDHHDDQNGNCHEHRNQTLVQVPINGLLDRLNAFSSNGVVVDSRVYAFAIGLKKGEKLAQAQFYPSESVETPI